MHQKYARKDRMIIGSLFISHNRKQDFLLSLLCTDSYHHHSPPPHRPPGNYYPALKTPTSASFSRSEFLLFYRVAFLFNLTVDLYPVAPVQQSKSLYFNKNSILGICMNLLQRFTNWLVFATIIYDPVSILLFCHHHGWSLFYSQIEHESTCFSLPGLLQKSTWKVLSVNQPRLLMWQDVHRCDGGGGMSV